MREVQGLLEEQSTGEKSVGWLAPFLARVSYLESARRENCERSLHIRVRVVFAAAAGIAAHMATPDETDLLLSGSPMTKKPSYSVHFFNDHGDNRKVCAPPGCIASSVLLISHEHRYILFTLQRLNSTAL